MPPSSPANWPALVGSPSSGVDGASEGGRESTVRLPLVLALYGVPLLKRIKSAGYAGNLDARPELVDGTWVLKLRYQGKPPEGVPALWHGHPVVLEEVPAQEPGGDASGPVAPARSGSPSLNG